MPGKTKKTVAFHTLGCKVNEYESGKLAKELENLGFFRVPFDSAADVYVVNTCSVTGIADHKSRQMLNRAKAMAHEHGALTVALGCYASLEKSGINADLVIVNKDRERAAELIETAFEELHSLEDGVCEVNIEPRSRKDIVSEANIESQSCKDRAGGTNMETHSRDDMVSEANIESQFREDIVCEANLESQSRKDRGGGTNMEPHSREDIVCEAYFESQSRKDMVGGTNMEPHSHEDIVCKANMEPRSCEDVISETNIETHSLTDGDDRAQKEILSSETNDSTRDIDPEPVRPRTRAFIKIEDGCDSFCSYCVIPYARGAVRSMDPDGILREVMECVSSGIKEIVITGINVNRYGTGLIKEKPLFTGEPLAVLLERIAAESGIGRIRLSSVEPGLINDEFVARIAAIPAICPHFHMALQSGSANVLKRMNRHYTPDEYKKSAELLRRYYEDPSLTTDVIVGFPGETDEEHKESLAFIRDLDLSGLNVFRFSGRRGTPAYSMPGQIRNAVKEERAHEMLSLDAGLKDAYKMRHKGKTLEVLLEETEADGSVSGYSREYIRVSVSEGMPGSVVKVTF